MIWGSMVFVPVTLPAIGSMVLVYMLTSGVYGWLMLPYIAYMDVILPAKNGGFYHQTIGVDDASGKKKHGFPMKQLDLRLPGPTIFGEPKSNSCSAEKLCAC